MKQPKKFTRGILVRVEETGTFYHLISSVGEFYPKKGNNLESLKLGVKAFFKNFLGLEVEVSTIEEELEKKPPLTVTRAEILAPLMMPIGETLGPIFFDQMKKEQDRQLGPILASHLRGWSAEQERALADPESPTEQVTCGYCNYEMGMFFPADGETYSDEDFKSGALAICSNCGEAGILNLEKRVTEKLPPNFLRDMMIERPDAYSAFAKLQNSAKKHIKNRNRGNE